MLRIKSGTGAARVWGLQPAMILAAMVCDSVMGKRGKDAVITCGIDGKHMAGSKHYVGLAFDMRTSELTPTEVAVVRNEIKSALGDDYDIVIEGNHLHVEVDPKQPYTSVA